MIPNCTVIVEILPISIIYLLKQQICCNNLKILEYIFSSINGESWIITDELELIKNVYII